MIEERYARWVWITVDEGKKAAANARMYDRKAGRPVFFPIRYADDFVILVSGTYDDAGEKKKEALATYLKETAKLTLSQEKTHITPIKKGFEFLGHRVRMKWEHHYGYRPRIEIPRKVADIRYRIKYPEASVKELTRSRRWSTIRRGYRAWHEGRQEHFHWGVSRWSGMHWNGCDGPITLWSLESRIHKETCTSGSERGYRRPAVERSYGACSLLYMQQTRTSAWLTRRTRCSTSSGSETSSR